MKKISSLKLWEKIWIPLSLVLISFAWFLEYILTPIEFRDNWLWQVIYFIATITGMLCVVLTSGKRYTQWIVGLVNILGFVLLYFHWELYGNFALNLFFYVPASFVGLYDWLKHREEKDICKVKNLTKKKQIILAICSIVSLFVIAVPLSFLDKGAGKPLTFIGFLDSAGTVLGVIGQLLLMFRYSEQWVIWIILDIVMTILNLVIGKYAMAIMYFLWTCNAIIGLLVWQKSIKMENSNSNE